MIFDFHETSLITVRPVCSHEHPMKYGVALGGNITITCEVEANPPVTLVTWNFKGPTRTEDLRPDQISHSGTKSYVNYR